MANYFKKNIRALRVINGFKQAEIADLFDLPRTTWGSYESGKSHPSLELSVEIAKYFGITVEQLVTVDLENVPNRISNVQSKQSTNSTKESTKYSTKLTPNFKELMQLQKERAANVANDPTEQYTAIKKPLNDLSNEEWQQIIADATTQAISSIEAARAEKTHPEIRKMRKEVEEYIKKYNLLEEKMKQLEKERSENAQKK